MRAEERGIRNFGVVLSTLDGGRLEADLSRELRKLNDELREHAEKQGKATGEITVKLQIKHKGGTVEITPHVSTKAPKQVRDLAIFWMTADGELTDRNPKQLKFDLRPIEGAGEGANGKAKEPPAEARVKAVQ